MVVMDRVFSVLVCAAVVCCVHAADTLTYDEMVTMAIGACTHRERLLSASFTNSLVRFSSVSTNTQEKSAAELALALALKERYDRALDCPAFDLSQQMSSNIAFGVVLPDDCWVKYAAAFDYMRGLNADGRERDGFVLSTNMVSRLADITPNMSVTNFWNGILSMERCAPMSFASAFKLNAAMDLARRGEWSALYSYTNSLPRECMQVFQEEL